MKTIGSGDKTHWMKEKKLKKHRSISIPDDAEKVEWITVEGEIYLCWLEPIENED